LSKIYKIEKEQDRNNQKKWFKTQKTMDIIKKPSEDEPQIVKLKIICENKCCSVNDAELDDDNVCNYLLN